MTEPRNGLDRDGVRRNVEGSRTTDLLTTLMDNILDHVYFKDVDGRFTMISKSLATAFGLGDPAEAVGRTDLDFFTEDQAGLADRDERLVISTGEPIVDLVERKTWPDLRRTWDSTTKMIHTDARGDVVGTFGISRDVTERTERAAERDRLVAALVVSESRLQTALDSMLEGVAIHTAIRDEGGRIVDFRLDYVNPMMAGIGRVPASDQVGHTFLELFPAHRTNGLFEAYRDVVETGHPFAADDFHYVDPDAAGGALDQYLDLHAAKLWDGCLHSVQDVSERHRGEFEMRRLALAIEQSADLIVITDTDGRIEYVNPAFVRVSGYTRAEVIGENPRLLKSGVHDPAFYTVMWANLASGQPFTADFTNRQQDGSLFHEESVISPIVDEAGEITSYLAVKRDVTRERAFVAAATRTAHERALIADTIFAAPTRGIPSRRPPR